MVCRKAQLVHLSCKKHRAFFVMRRVNEGHLTEMLQTIFDRCIKVLVGCRFVRMDRRRIAILGCTLALDLHICSANKLDPEPVTVSRSLFTSVSQILQPVVSIKLDRV